MIKKTIYLFLCSLLLISAAFSQNSNMVSYIATGSFGAATIDGKIYNQISFRPEIKIKKMGIGLDINIYINENGEIYSGNWKFDDTETAFQSIMDKIYYVRWGTKHDKFYFRAGSLESVTLGYGALIERYTNALEYPQVKKLGLDFIYGTDKIKFEYVQSDFKTTPSLIALGTVYNLAPRINLFLNLAHDMNQWSRLDDIPSNINYEDYMDICLGLIENNPDIAALIDCEEEYQKSINESQYSGKNNVSGISIGADYVFSEKMAFYTELVKLIGKTGNNEEDELGSGIIFPGLSYRFKNGKFQIEGRHVIADNFVFNYWDRSYDIQRTVQTSDDQYYTKEEELFNFKKMSGLYTYFTYDLLNVMNFFVGYQDLRGDDPYKSFTSSINVNPNLIPKVQKIEFFYQANNVNNPFEITEGLIHGYDIGVEASERMTITYQSRTTYRKDQNGEYEPVRIMQLDTQFDF